MYSVLIVDDSEIIRSVLSKTLRMTKIPFADIFQASNGKEALSVMNQSWVDMVLTDLNMPEMSGFDLIDVIHKRNDLNLIPIVVISTEGSTLRIEELKSKGIIGYLRKPFAPVSIRETINKVLESWNG